MRLSVAGFAGELFVVNPNGSAVWECKRDERGLLSWGATCNLEWWHGSCLQHFVFVAKKSKKKVLHNRHGNKDERATGQCGSTFVSEENTQLGIFSPPWINPSIIFNLHLLSSVNVKRQQDWNLRLNGPDLQFVDADICFSQMHFIMSKTGIIQIQRTCFVSSSL